LLAFQRTQNFVWQSHGNSEYSSIELNIAQYSSNAAQWSSSQLTSTEKRTKITASNPPTKLTPHA